jgi:hypothetical protein
MKFHQLQTGQRFLYQEQVYIKVSPVIARHEESGEQKFLRRADSVQQLAEESLPAEATSMRKNIEIKKVTKLFDDFFRQAQSIIETELQDLPVSRREKIFSQMHNAGRDLLQGLGRR